MRNQTVCLVAWLTACAADGSAPPCRAPSGDYRVTARERSGTCGPIPDEVDSTDTGELPGCMQTAYPPDPGETGCTLTYSRSCRARDGSLLVLGVSIERQEDDETWSGAADVEAQDASGRTLCHSLYTVTFTKR